MRSLEQLKHHFLTAEIPKTLNGKDRFYSDVEFTINVLIKSAEDNPSDSRAYKRAVNNLNVLIKDLEDRTQWNASQNKSEIIFNFD